MKDAKMQAQAINGFFVSVATMLFITGVAKLYSATGTAKILSLEDPILYVNNRVLLMFLGMLEVAIALYVLVRRNRANDLHLARLLAWLSANFIGYRAAITFLGVSTCPCLGTLGAKLPVAHQVVQSILAAIVFYCFLGSILIIALSNTAPDAAREESTVNALAAHL